MGDVTNPIRVDRQTDAKISHAASLLGVTKKALVEEAVNAYLVARAADLETELQQVVDLLELPIVVSQSSMERVVKLLESPPPPTDALRALMDR